MRTRRRVKLDNGSVRVEQEISKDLLVCPLCKQGYDKGIPLDRLATMHRPVLKQTPKSAGAVAPRGGATSSPREQLALGLGDSKVDRLVASILSEVDKPQKRRKPPKKVKYENLKKKTRPKQKEQT